KHDFALSGKVKHGDIVEYRIAVTDNRDIPEVNPPLTPQTSYYPPEGWLRLKVVNSVGPINERDVLAQRDDINKRIEKIKADLRVEKRQAYGVQQESRNDDRLSDDHKERLAQIRKDNQKSRQDLADLVREVGDTPALDQMQLQNLAERQQKLADKAAELAAKDPLRDPSALQQKADIQREQNEAAAELQRLADQSEELRKSLDAARAEQAKELADKARE